MDDLAKPFVEDTSKTSESSDGVGCPVKNLIAPAALSVLIAWVSAKWNFSERTGLSTNLEDLHLRWHIGCLLCIMIATCLPNMCGRRVPRCASIIDFADKACLFLWAFWCFTVVAYLNVALLKNAWISETTSTYYSTSSIAALVIVLALLCIRKNQLDLVNNISVDFKWKRNGCDFKRRLGHHLQNIRPVTLTGTVFWWMKNCLGLFAGALFFGAALTQFIASPSTSRTSIFLCLRIAFGCLVVIRKCKKMLWQTIRGNAEVVAKHGVNDWRWAMYVKPCSYAQILMVVWLYYDALPSEDGNIAEAIPFGASFANALAILIMSSTLLVWIALSACCIRGWFLISDILWCVRCRDTRGNNPVDRNILQIYLPLLGLYPNQLWDRFGLNERMARRLDHHCCLEWAASKGLRYFTFPELMVEEKELFEAPAVNDIDCYTKIMLYSVKVMTVEAGRLNPLFMKEVKRPFPKQSIDTWKAPVAGLEMARWDEQYSTERLKRTESSSQFELQLKLLHGLFKAIEDPRWFKNELEGVLTYEAVVAPFAAMCNTVWKDLVSDQGIELLAFNGLGQFLLRGRSSKELKDLSPSRSFFFSSTPRENGKKVQMPQDVARMTEYVMDYSWIGDYGVRKKCARYGFIACFDADQKLRYIYVCHWKDKKEPWRANGWVERPSASASPEDKQKKCWEHAKYVIKASLGAGVTINDHLLCAHWIVANTASLAVRTHLQYHHPIRRLMHTFVLRTASINYASTLTLLPEDRFVHRAAGFEYSEMARCVSECAQRFSFKTFPDVVKESGLGSLDETRLPWARDGLRLWGVIYEFVNVFVGMYYLRDEDVTGDEELMNFWKMISNTPHGFGEKEERNGLDCAPGFGYKLPELGAGDGALANLTNYLTHVIFWVTANHEYYGALAEYFTTPMGLATKIFDEDIPGNHLDDCGQVMSDIQTYMQDLCVVSATGYPQPRFLSEWAFLLHLPDREAREKMKMDVRDVKLATPNEQVEEYLKILMTLPNYVPISPQLALSYNRRRDDQKETSNGNHTSIAVDEIDARIGQESSLLSQVHGAFMENLRRLDWEIDQDNKSRAHPFEAFKPTNLECSVNI